MAVKLISHEINFSDLVYSSVWQEATQQIAIWEGYVPEKHYGCIDESLIGNCGVITAMPPANADLSGGEAMGILPRIYKLQPVNKWNQLPQLTKLARNETKIRS
jgi:hypothetical protein